MLKPTRKPYGYKELLVYQKAEELQKHCSLLTSHFPHSSHYSPSTPLKTLLALADQMNRSARSTKQNIVEGWKRNSTSEYYEFLGYSIASNAELEEDCNDIWNGKYPELMGVKGLMGEKGEMGIMGERGTPSAPLTPLSSSTFPTSPAYPVSPTPSAPLTPSSLSSPFDDIESLPFYPLDKNLPPIVQLKLKCKELNYLLERLQKSLAAKMGKENTLTSRDKFQLMENEKKKVNQFEKGILNQYDIKNRKDD
jgi:four helix bundle protein